MTNGLEKAKKMINLPDTKELILISIINAMGGHTDASDYDWHWLRWFCDDEVPGGDDTFNRCINRGWMRSTHDSDTDSSTAYITPLGIASLQQEAQVGSQEQSKPGLGRQFRRSDPAVTDTGEGEA